MKHMVVIEKGKASYGAHVPDLHGCIAVGPSREEVLRLICETDIDNLHITIDKEGARAYSKVSYPLRYGRFSEIKTPEYVFQFNLNGELKFINGRGKGWPDRSEWLKRTITDDWVYYSAGGYDGSYDSFGEYYIPRLSYPSNNINSSDPFNDNAVMSAIKAWGRLHENLTDLNSGSLEAVAKLFTTVKSKLADLG